MLVPKTFCSLSFLLFYWSISCTALSELISSTPLSLLSIQSQLQRSLKTMTMSSASKRAQTINHSLSTWHWIHKYKILTREEKLKRSLKRLSFPGKGIKWRTFGRGEEKSFEVVLIVSSFIHANFAYLVYHLFEITD